MTFVGVFNANVFLTQFPPQETFFITSDNGIVGGNTQDYSQHTKWTIFWNC